MGAATFWHALPVTRTTTRSLKLSLYAQSKATVRGKIKSLGDVLGTGSVKQVNRAWYSPSGSQGMTLTLEL